MSIKKWWQEPEIAGGALIFAAACIFLIACGVIVTALHEPRIIRAENIGPPIELHVHAVPDAPKPATPAAEKADADCTPDPQPTIAPPVGERSVVVAFRA